MLTLGLVLVLLVAGLSAFVWLWAVRKPPLPPASEEADEAEDAPPATLRPFAYVSIGNTDVNALFHRVEPSTEEGWVYLLRSRLPADTALTTLARQSRTLAEANDLALAATVDARPDLITVWQVVGDSTGGTTLTAYLGELRRTLNTLIHETEAQVVLLNLPDITRMMQDLPEERKSLIRGGIEQWNRVIAEVASHHGGRVLIPDLYIESARVLNATTGNRYLADMVWELLPE